MKEIVVISGKGGTGKTSLSASFAVLAGNVVVADCDVDAADLYLVLEPEIVKESAFSGGRMPVIRQDACTGCGVCNDVCRFNAVNTEISKDDPLRTIYTINPVACEGCGVCAWFCPEKAIDFNPAINGKWFISNTRVGPMVHARLNPTEENSGKLVTLVRQEAGQIAKENNHDFLVVDGSPGIGCPVIASITGADLIVIVTEPTVSGEHDLKRVHELAKGFNIPDLLCVNKSDINTDMTDRLVAYAEREGMQVAGNVRYDKAFSHAQVVKKTVIEYTNDAVSDDIRRVWDNIRSYLYS